MLNYEEIKKFLQGITEIKPFINKCNWEGINFPPKKWWLEKIGKYSAPTALNNFFDKKEKIYPAYVSKHNSSHEKQLIILMFSSKEKLWHYLPIKTKSIIKRNKV